MANHLERIPAGLLSKPRPQANGSDGEKSDGGCGFSVPARDLSITWGDDPRYWRWLKLEEPREVGGEMVELLAVCWLEVRGVVETRKLCGDVEYEVAFLVMVKEGAGWETPVNLKMSLPGGNTQERREDLGMKKRGEWMKIPVGRFCNVNGLGGEIEFSLYEYGGHWKSGLVIGGAVVTPCPRVIKQGPGRSGCVVMWQNSSQTMWKLLEE